MKTKPPAQGRDQKKAAFLEILAKCNGIIYTACTKAKGIASRGTIYNWIRKDPDFAGDVARIEQMGVDFSEIEKEDLKKKLSIKNIQLKAAEKRIDILGKENAKLLSMLEGNAEADSLQYKSARILGIMQTVSMLQYQVNKLHLENQELYVDNFHLKHAQQIE